MDNPKKPATLGTQDTGRRQTKHRKLETKKMGNNTDPNKPWAQWGRTQAPAKGKQFLPNIFYYLM